MSENNIELEVASQRIVAIIPAYNESAHISKVVSLTKQYVNLVIVVDDGSRDNTYSLAVESGADVVARHPINSGKGVALSTGFMLAEKYGADIIITIDADLQHDPSRIPELVSLIKNEGIDIVIGSRKKNKKMPIVFSFGNFVLNQTFYRLFGQKIKDTQSGYRAFAKGVYSKIAWRSSGYVVETEMLAHACSHNLKIGEITIETTYHDRYKGTTIFDGIKIFMHMISWKLFG